MVSFVITSCNSQKNESNKINEEAVVLAKRVGVLLINYQNSLDDNKNSDSIKEFDLNAEFDSMSEKQVVVSNNDFVLLDSALGLLDSAILIEPNFQWAFIKRNEIYGIKKDINAAIKNTLKMIELNPENPNYCSLVGVYYEVNKQLSLSEKYYTKSLSLYNQLLRKEDLSGDVSFRLGHLEILLNLKMDVQAYEVLKGLREDFPDDIIVKHISANFENYKADVFESKNQIFKQFN
jgi:tetratricopeptide (TPR) repeat protein